ncbi:MAG: hypothetical protein U9N79_00490 [Actinomycetota bacterium]|nr:hypothetical protein [Actinomycetota bacterium]
MQKILDLDRRLLIGIPVAVLILLLIGFGIGRLTAGSSAVSASDAGVAGSTSPDAPLQSDDPDTPPRTITGDAATVLPPSSDAPDGEIPVYGTEEQREEYLAGLIDSSLIGGSRTGLLATADHVCYNLERLEAQNRSPAFAVRVVWNESLAELDSEDLAAFGVVFAAAPYYLCPASIEYGEEVAYWLGY